MGHGHWPLQYRNLEKITSGVVNNKAELIRVRFQYDPKGNGSHVGKEQGSKHEREMAQRDFNIALFTYKCGVCRIGQGPEEVINGDWAVDACGNGPGPETIAKTTANGLNEGLVGVVG